MPMPTCTSHSISGSVTSSLPTGIRFTSGISESATSAIKTLKELEKEAIQEALRFTGGNKQEASVLLGIGKTTLYEKIKAYGLDNLSYS